MEDIFSQPGVFPEIQASLRISIQCWNKKQLNLYFICFYRYRKKDFLVDPEFFRKFRRLLRKLV